jgi:hypothetical protein
MKTMKSLSLAILATLALGAGTAMAQSSTMGTDKDAKASPKASALAPIGKAEAQSETADMRPHAAPATPDASPAAGASGSMTR